MATARLNFGVLGKNAAQVMLPVGTTEKVTFTTAAQSAAFDDGADVMRFEADADAYLLFGTDPTATEANGLKVASGSVEYFAIRPGDKVSIYDGSS